MIKTIRDFDLNLKRVIIRVDFNVPIKDNKILDDNRIIESLETINYAIDNNAKVILLSHLGRIKSEDDLQTKTLKPVAERLSELLGKEVIFINETRGMNVEEKINSMQPGDIVLIENTRFEDYPNKLESKNNEELGKYWASLGDVFINDAFGTSHRKHASNVGISINLPSGIGFLIEKEIENIESVITNPKRPFTVILGGAKVSDKIKVIENLVNIADYILIGGGMANTFIKAQGYELGKSLVDEDSMEFCKEILKKYNDKIVLPTDLIGAKNIRNEEEILKPKLEEVPNDFIALDVGEKTIEIFKEKIDLSQTIIWNGPLGMFELENFVEGTKKIAEYLANTNKEVIIGGGDTASAVINFGFKDSYTHISTGGGASLEMLEGKKLPAIEILK